MFAMIGSTGLGGMIGHHNPSGAASGGFDVGGFDEQVFSMSPEELEAPGILSDKPDKEEVK